MIDVKLENLRKYTDSNYVDQTLKYKFNEEYWSFYDMPVPKNIELFDKYEYKTKVFNEYTTEYDEYDLGSTLDKFVEETLTKDFDELIINFYNEVKFLDDKFKIKNYYKLLLEQLEQLLSEIILNNKPTISVSFENGIKKFKNCFGENVKFQTRIVKTPDSFKYKHINRKEYLIDILFKDLINNELIDRESKKRDFSKVFSGEKVKVKVVWIASVSEFFYFIKKITNLGVIENCKNKWIVAGKCFYVEKRNTKKEIDYKKLKGQKNPSPLKMEVIDKIVNDFFDLH